MLNEKILREFETILGKERILTSKEDMLSYAYDAYVEEYLPEAVLFPKTTAEVSQIMKAANTNRVFVTPRGAGSGLAGCSLAKKGGVVLSLTMMNHILEINKPNRYAIVEPGVVVSEFQKEVEKIGLFYPPDPGSSMVATMAGTVMMNAGGMRGIKYGVTRDYLLGLEAVLPSGEIIQTGSLTAKDVTGYDLTRLICGSEGTLAVVTRIIVKLLPKPKARRTLQAIYNSIDQAGTTVARIVEEGIIPATLELMDKMIIKALEDFAHLGLPLDAEAILVIEVDGDPESVDKQAGAIAEFCRGQGARDVRVAQSEKESEQLWVARRGAFGAVARMRPACVIEDATVPVSFLTRAIKEVITIAQRNQVQIAVLAHAGDGNLHPLVLCDLRDKEEMKRVDKAMDEIVDFAISVGGVLSGEHGIGIAKAKYLSRQISPQVLNLMRALKNTFDPRGILNPGSFLECAQ
ncbi:MAG: FAD-binding protein [Deltaproteobacteria bacterium]|nr:FAD-binding protein [Deltaproteobacteria bacterium]